MEANEYLLKLYQTIREMESVDLFAGAAKLSKTEFRLIREIVLEGEKGNSIISSELARRLGITRSAVSQAVTKLEERDVVKRTPSETDKKIAYIRLSDRALSVYEAQCREVNDVIDRVVKDLGAEKVDRLIEAYDEFASALSRAKKAYQKEHPGSLSCCKCSEVNE